MAGAQGMTKGRAIKDEERSFVPLPREVLEDIPQLRDKAVIDVLNGVKVVGDHLRWRDENPGSAPNRIWALITGDTARRQQALDRNVEGVLIGVKDWLTALTAAQPKSDKAITEVAQHLHKTRRCVMDLAAKEKILQREVTAIRQQLDEHIEQTEKQLSEILEELRLESTGRKAWNAVEWVESRWKSGGFDAFPPFLRAVLAANNLYWSDFGAFLRANWRNEEDVARLCEHARQTLAALTHDVVAGGQKGPAAIEEWLVPLESASMSADRHDVAVYLLEDSSCHVQPLAASAAARLRGTDEAHPNNLPRLMLPKYLGEFAVREVERRIVAEGKGGEGT